MSLFAPVSNICDCRCMSTEFGPLESGDTDPLSFVLIFCIMMFAADSLVEAVAEGVFTVFTIGVSSSESVLLYCRRLYFRHLLFLD
jgi:hypothetical protein